MQCATSTNKLHVVCCLARLLDFRKHLILPRGLFSEIADPPRLRSFLVREFDFGPPRHETKKATDRSAIRRSTARHFLVGCPEQFLTQLSRRMQVRFHARSEFLHLWSLSNPPERSHYIGNTIALQINRDASESPLAAPIRDLRLGGAKQNHRRAYDFASRAWLPERSLLHRYSRST